MASRKQARAAELRAWIDEQGIASIGDQEFVQACERFPRLKPDALRKSLRDCGVRLSPIVEGVRQESFDELERTLVALSAEYIESDRDRSRSIRRLVITAKEHARFAARSAKDETKRSDKTQMAEWMLVWLENPPLFPDWVRIRRKVAAPDPDPVGY